MIHAKAEQFLQKIKAGEILKIKLYRSGEQFLDGKYDEIEIEISFDSGYFQVYKIKSEILWDGAAGAGPTYTDEESTQMTEDELLQYLTTLLTSENHDFEIN